MCQYYVEKSVLIMPGDEENREAANVVFSLLNHFTFDAEFKPLPGAAAYQLSNPPLLQTVSLLGSLNVSACFGKPPDLMLFIYKVNFGYLYGLLCISFGPRELNLFVYLLS